MMGVITFLLMVVCGSIVGVLAERINDKVNRRDYERSSHERLMNELARHKCQM